MSLVKLAQGDHAAHGVVIQIGAYDYDVGILERSDLQKFMRT